jgi:pSer/pThr/pTyr-binding forkhead associated (FHA) protein
MGANTVGREPAADVWLDSGSVSRRHARLLVADDGAQLEDLDSKNGTSINGHSVREAAPLQDGDRLLIGAVPLTYRTSASGMSTETRASAINDPRPLER